MRVNVSHMALWVLSVLVSGQNVKQQNTTAGKMAHFINGMRRPLGLVLLSLNEAMKGSKMASTNLPDAAITDMIFNTPKSINCGMSGFKPALFGGR